MRWLREVDWNWRNFSGGEWVLIAAAVLSAFGLPILVIDRQWRSAATGGLTLLLIGFVFVNANVKRQVGALPKPSAARVTLVLVLAVAIAIAAFVTAWIAGPGV